MHHPHNPVNIMDRPTPEPHRRVEVGDAKGFGDRPFVAGTDVPTIKRGVDGPLVREPQPNPDDDDAAAQPRRHPFFWLVLFTGILTLAAFGYSAFFLVRDGRTIRSFGWTEATRSNGSFVASVDPSGPAAGRLQSGDRLILLNGVPPIGPAGTVPQRRRLVAGDTYQVTIARNGEQRDVTLMVMTRPTRLASRLTYFVVSLVWCGVGLFIGFARPDQQVARLAFLSALATGHVFLEVGVLQHGLLVAPLHVVLGYHFFCRFPSGPIPRGGWKYALGLLYAVGGAGVAVGLLLQSSVLMRGAAEAARYAGLVQFQQRSMLWVFTGGVVAMLAVIPHKYRQLTDEDQRRRVRWVAYVSSVALAPNIWYAAVALFQGPVGPGLSLLTNTSSVAVPICMAYVVVKHRVFDITVAVRRGVQYLFARRALQAAVALPVAALLYTVVANRHRTIAQIATENTGYVFWMAAAALGLRFRRPIQVGLDRRFFREQYDREQLLIGLLDDVGKIESISELSRLVALKLEIALHPKAAYLWYRDPREFAVASSSNPRLTPPDAPSGGRWLAQVEARSAATALPVSALADLSREEARWFADRKVDLIVPIVDNTDRVVGALLLGEKKSEEPYSASDRRIFQAIARQAAAVRENLRLRERASEDQRIRHDVLAKLDGHLPDLLKECPACGSCFDGAVDCCERDGQALVLSLPVARTLDGRYRLEQLIGKGGMGAVYQAYDFRLQRTVAVKIILGRAFGQPAALRRFQREAHAAARLNHPNIVSVYDFGPLEGQGAYLVMERVSGRTLRAELDRTRLMSPAAAIRWFAPLLAGLAAAHAQGIIHRDMKPENVIGWLESDQALGVKILDFGLAKVHAAETPAVGTVTAEGVVMGTFGYMSPEQLLGREVDHRTDIFAVGVMLVEALTGRKPFEGETYLELSRALAHDDYHLPGASSTMRVVDDVVRKCLARDPRDRYASASTLQLDLIAALAATSNF